MAGGPLILEGPDDNTPVTYQNPNITINIEAGALGSLSNEEADILVLEAFDLWNRLSSSAVNLIIDQSQIAIDIHIDNFTSYLPSGSEFHNNDGLNPFVYDTNGEIIDALFGVDASQDIVGVAASIFTDNALYFSEGFAVINGKKTLSDADFTLLITHEIGHFLGLDHSQINIDNQETIFGLPQICTTSTQEHYPVMYPFICRETATLHADDISAITSLYPAPDIFNTMGIIQGRFVDETGSAILGANIWSKNTTTGEVYSIVSDYLTQGTGFYKLLLPAGNYTLHANSINTGFSGGSGVGPYSTTPFDASFISPHPIEPVTFQDASDGGDMIITVLANQTIEINFSSDPNYIVNITNPATGDDDSIADLFGATSHLTLLGLLSFLLIGRSIKLSGGSFNPFRN